MGDVRTLKSTAVPPTGGEPPYDDQMEARLDKLETFAETSRERLARIETKLDAVATKGEIHDLKAELIKWVVATAVGLGVAAITVMTFVLNNAVPKTAAAVQPAPIIINIPQSAAPVPTQAPK